MGKKIEEKSQQYLDVYRKKYLCVWEKIILTSMILANDPLNTTLKTLKYKSIEDQINKHLVSMNKVAEDAEVYLRKLKDKTEFQLVKAQCIYYQYQFKKILITIYQFRYETSKKQQSIAQEDLSRRFEELVEYYHDHEEMILEINPEEKSTILVMQIDLGIHIKDAAGLVLSPIEKELKAADLIKDPDKSDERFRKAIALADNDIVRYEILRRRMGSYLGKEKDRIGNGYYKTSDVEGAKLKYGIYFLERMQEKLKLLEKLNIEHKYDTEEKDSIDTLTSFIRIFLELKLQEDVLSGLLNLVCGLVKKFPEYENKYQEIKQLFDATNNKNIHFDESDKIDESTLREEYDARFADILAEFGIASLIEKKKPKNKPLRIIESTNDEAINDEVTDVVEESSPLIVSQTLPTNDALLKLSEAELHKTNAESALKKTRLRGKAISEFNAAKSALNESLQLYLISKKKDPDFLIAIETVISHTELLLQQTLQAEKNHVDRLNYTRMIAKNDCIAKYGKEAWYKNSPAKMSPAAEIRKEAILNLEQLEIIYKQIVEIKIHLPAKDIIAERRSIKDGFRFFRNNCPPDNPARKLTRSCSVDSFLSPENQLCLIELRRRFGR